MNYKILYTLIGIGLIIIGTYYLTLANNAPKKPQPPTSNMINDIDDFLNIAKIYNCYVAVHRIIEAGNETYTVYYCNGVYKAVANHGIIIVYGSKDKGTYILRKTLKIPSFRNYVPPPLIAFIEDLKQNKNSSVFKIINDNTIDIKTPKFECYLNRSGIVKKLIEHGEYNLTMVYLKIEPKQNLQIVPPPEIQKVLKATSFNETTIVFFYSNQCPFCLKAKHVIQNISKLGVNVIMCDADNLTGTCKSFGRPIYIPYALLFYNGTKKEYVGLNGIIKLNETIHKLFHSYLKRKNETIHYYNK